MKNIFFWGGVTTHLYEVVKDMTQYFDRVYAIVTPNCFERKERAPQAIDGNVVILHYNEVGDVAKIACLGNVDDSIHVNGALKIGNLNNKALKYLCQKGYHVVSFPQEPFQLYGIKGVVNYLKWFYYLHCTYRSKIDAYGLTGLKAERHFKSLLVPSHKMFQFLYVTKQTANVPIVKNKRIKFIYVGAIDKRKNIIPFIQWMMNYDNQDFDFEIYGSWDLDNVLEKIINGCPHIAYFGKKDYSVVRSAMCKADWLVLPSLHDGWGAVVNEGLQAGCKILVSEQCGASSLVVRNSFLGYVFDARKCNHLKGIMDTIFSKGPLTISEHEMIREWATSHIGSKVVGKYLNEVLRYYYGNASKPTPFWL